MQQFNKCCIFYPIYWMPCGGLLVWITNEHGHSTWTSLNKFIPLYYSRLIKPPFEYHVNAWQVSLWMKCNDVGRLWMCFNGNYKWFWKIRNIVNEPLIKLTPTSKGMYSFLQCSCCQHPAGFTAVFIGRVRRIIGQLGPVITQSLTLPEAHSI